MATAHGLLEDETVYVDDPDEVSQLQDKGAYGRTVDRGLALSLHEAAYLVEEDRLVVRDGESRAIVPVDKLIATGAGDAGFETRHLVYREYRSRGFVVQAGQDRYLDAYERGAQPPGSKPSTLLAARGEAEPGNPAFLLEHVAKAHELGRTPLLGVVDEESDVTYYEVDHATVTGSVQDPAPQRAGSGEALLLQERAILRDDPGLAEAGYGYETGGQRFLSLAEAHHLARHGLTLHGRNGEPKSAEDVQERALAANPSAEVALEAYTWVRQRDLVPKTGFKYGVHFRVYEEPPGTAHAPYLVQGVEERADWTLRDVSRFVRLAHSVNKDAVVFSPSGALMVRWTRP